MTAPRGARRTYSLTQYRADLARLDALASAEAMVGDALPFPLTRRTSPPGPPESMVCPRRDTVPGGFVAAPVAAAVPVTKAVLRAVGLVRPAPGAGRLRCHWLAVVLAVVTTLAALPGCGPGWITTPELPADPDPWGAPAPGGAALPPCPSTALVIWPADADLENVLIKDTVPRIAAATGLLVRVATHLEEGAVPMFWASELTEEGVWGYDMAGPAPWIGIAPDVPADLVATTALHETLHALGAGHVGDGAGVLSPHVWKPFALSAADLEAVCAVRECAAFEPEG